MAITGGRLMAGERQRRGERLRTPCSRSHSSGWKEGRCPALRAGGWGWGWATRAPPARGAKGPLGLVSPGVRPPPPAAATPPRIHPGLLNPSRPGCSGCGGGGALAGRPWGVGRPPPGCTAQAGHAGRRASAASGGSEAPGVAGSRGRDASLGRPGGFGAPGLFLIIGANGVLYSPNPTHMVS